MSAASSPPVQRLTPEPHDAQTFATIGIQNSPQDSVQRTDSTDTASGARNQPQTAGASRNDAQRPTVAHNGPLEDDLDRELRELEAWHEKATKQEKIARLRAAQAKYNAGDVQALQLVANDSQPAALISPAPTSGLPRPEPPHVFTKRNRADFNRWKRDCERYFDRLPANFSQEWQKVDFGAQYLSETMKSLWEAYRLDQPKNNPIWEPTWEAMKAVMLGSLGTLSERRQRAYEALHRAKMLPHGTPTELLDYMRPYWEELGETHGPELQVMGYIHALPEEIQKQLFMYPEERRVTLTQVEEAANTIYRQRARSKNPRDEKPAKDQSKQTKGSKDNKGPKETPKRAKEGSPSHNSQKRPRGSQPKANPSAVTCYGCGEAGHIQPNCPNPNTSKKPKEGSEVGKGKGRKD